eukprot:GHVU01005670.1.p1 GENE.GHVU01005670.1~~GHVU01005670.1.p1  ORF type:complete len:561 (+),score=73.79 GHVU01005670.1:37-1719(+)
MSSIDDEVSKALLNALTGALEALRPTVKKMIKVMVKEQVKCSLLSPRSEKKRLSENSFSSPETNKKYKQSQDSGDSERRSPSEDGGGRGTDRGRYIHGYKGVSHAAESRGVRGDRESALETCRGDRSPHDNLRGQPRHDLPNVNDTSSSSTHGYRESACRQTLKRRGQDDRSWNDNELEYDDVVEPSMPRGARSMDARGGRGQSRRENLGGAGDQSGVSKGHDEGTGSGQHDCDGWSSSFREALVPYEGRVDSMKASNEWGPDPKQDDEWGERRERSDKREDRWGDRGEERRNWIAEDDGGRRGYRDATRGNDTWALRGGERNGQKEGGRGGGARADLDWGVNGDDRSHYRDSYGVDSAYDRAGGPRKRPEDDGWGWGEGPAKAPRRQSPPGRGTYSRGESSDAHFNYSRINPHSFAARGTELQPSNDGARGYSSAKPPSQATTITAAIMNGVDNRLPLTALMSQRLFSKTEDPVISATSAVYELFDKATKEGNVKKSPSGQKVIDGNCELSAAVKSVLGGGGVDNETDRSDITVFELLRAIRQVQASPGSSRPPESSSG